MQQAVSTSGQQAGWEKREYILILQRPLYIPGQFSCNVFYITILIILQNKAVVVCGAQKKKEGFWCHSEELCYTVWGSIGSALLFYTTQAQKEALPVQKSSSQNKWEVSSAYFDFSWQVSVGAITKKRNSGPGLRGGAQGIRNLVTVLHTWRDFWGKTSNFKSFGVHWMAQNHWFEQKGHHPLSKWTIKANIFWKSTEFSTFSN